MRALSAAELLDAWERSAVQSPAWRPLALLAAAGVAVPPEAAADWTIGRRDAELLRLRERTFGSRFAATVACPECGERLELAFDAGEIRARDEDAAAPVGELAFAVAGCELRCRLPTGRDLAAVAAHGDLEAARRALVGRCLLSARRSGEEVTESDLPAEVVAAIEERMEAADPQAHVLLDLSCTSCARRWQAPFDVDAFFWAELDAWARRTLAEVHALAAAYGWSEAEVLALSAARRHLYLEMVGAAP